MGKEGDLWDDSALIYAADQAISTYKVMHSSKNKDNSAEMEQVTGSTGEVDSKNDFENLETGRVVDEKSCVPVVAPDSGETINASDLEENNHADSQAAKTDLDASGGQDIKHSLEAHNNYPHTQGVDEYNRLLGQYYEVEGQRQKILEQLNQYGRWNYQYTTMASNSGVQYPNSQDYSMSTCHVSAPNVLCSCSPCCSQCLLPLCTSVSCCTLSGTCAGKHCNDQSVARCPEKAFPCEDDSIFKTAMEVAESAMSTIRTTINGDPDKKEEKERNHSELDQRNGSEPDLAVVLNAWFSAGFYTGKYLTKKSIADRRQG